MLKRRCTRNAEWYFITQFESALYSNGCALKWPVNILACTVCFYKSFGVGNHLILTLIVLTIEMGVLGQVIASNGNYILV